MELYYILDTFWLIFKSNGFLLAMASVCYQDTSGLYYKRVMIVIDTPSVVSK
jgi:hypothetical protein